MRSFGPRELEGAVLAICPDIEARLKSVPREVDERRLWWELSSCLLSSQVPFNVAVAAAEAIDAAGVLLDPAKNRTAERLTIELENILRMPVEVSGKPRMYRFWKTKADQLARTSVVVNQHGGSLAKLLSRFDDASTLRAWFVNFAPGIGPKQSSMFLRNIGLSYELAVLDRHVLNYMAALGLYKGSHAYITGLKAYRSYEHMLRVYADRIGYRVGLLDWAIWVVMRVAREMKPMLRPQ